MGGAGNISRRRNKEGKEQAMKEQGEEDTRGPATRPAMEQEESKIYRSKSKSQRQKVGRLI